MTVLLIKEWRRTKKYLVKYLMFSISLVTTNQLRRLKIIQLDICGFVTVINSHIVTVWTYKLHIMKNNMYSLQSHYFTYSISHKIVTMKSTKITKLVPHKFLPYFQCFSSFWENWIYSFTPLYFQNYIQGYGIEFCMSYIHSRTMYAVPMERAWKDNSNDNKFAKILTYRVLIKKLLKARKNDWFYSTIMGGMVRVNWFEVTEWY